MMHIGGSDHTELRGPFTSEELEELKDNPIARMTMGMIATIKGETVAGIVKTENGARFIGEDKV